MAIPRVTQPEKETKNGHLIRVGERRIHAELRNEIFFVKL